MTRILCTLLFVCCLSIPSLAQEKPDPKENAKKIEKLQKQIAEKKKEADKTGTELQKLQTALVELQAPRIAEIKKTLKNEFDVGKRAQLFEEWSDIYAGQARPKEALEILNMLVKLVGGANNSTAEVLEKRALLYEELGCVHEALADYEIAVKRVVFAPNIPQPASQAQKDRLSGAIDRMKERIHKKGLLAD